jgi:hypothetical protein
MADINNSVKSIRNIISNNPDLNYDDVKQLYLLSRILTNSCRDKIINIKMSQVIANFNNNLALNCENFNEYEITFLNAFSNSLKIKNYYGNPVDKGVELSFDVYFFEQKLFQVYLNAQEGDGECEIYGKHHYVKKIKYNINKWNDVLFDDLNDDSNKWLGALEHKDSENKQNILLIELLAQLLEHTSFTLTVNDNMLYFFKQLVNNIYTTVTETHFDFDEFTI